ncbi:MAG: alternative ribosome rescue aminoacyl-tRNA hydrolase ArfB [Sedimenticola sp.]|uniref:Aminoacyl-tRNA hydrolase n=1 Tax=Sedimenticola thiotaurini TaxID=1543721 RepID=A0A558D3Q4_9GAMM|nr:alternative ribosome rescue aminoacyl-tRNA hydrolase ArfB [Sedimenticola sp.]MCW8920431.1 alternative ribosome rescue aminoacyl-tRNA hydrolase ArfB [Sedimenticola sp.]MCW8946972.1 alternative ribosome rescue aminoacyl-tRNA hydrolase ArfB [Sedimenticola sp.]TVT55648.1 MAG: aminoacyl-tRNA hydrolase [Sedimenticola thiotaurini]
MLQLTRNIVIPERELEFSAIRAQGAGGQNVNKVSTAIHLRFDIKRSSLPENYKERLLSYKDQRITQDGVVIIKAQQFRSQEKNKEEALQRLKQLILQANTVQKPRRATKPSKSSQLKRLDSKERKGKIKALRGRVID